MRRGALACRIVVALLVLPGTSVAMSPELQQQWNAVAASYMQGTPGGREGLLSLARSEVPDDLPPLLRLVLGDAYLRAGSLHKASRQFDEVLGSEPGDPWIGLAAIGRGWVATARGNLAEAREYFDVGAHDPGTNGLVATFMTAMIDAARGDTDAAIAGFDALSKNGATPDALRAAAVMGGGYARLWAGDDAGAHAVFASMAADARDEQLADDAMYLTGLTQWRSGDPAGAAATLGTVTEGSRGPSRREPAHGGGLDPRRLVRASLKRYRQLPVRAPVDLVVPMLDLDGAALARRALRLMAAGAPPPSPVLGGQSSARRDVPVPHVRGVLPDRSARPSIPAPAPAAPHARSLLAWILVASVAAAWFLRRTRQRAR